MLVTTETAATRSPRKRARITSGTVDMPTASAPRTARGADFGRGLERGARRTSNRRPRADRTPSAAAAARSARAHRRVVRLGHAARSARPSARRSAGWRRQKLMWSAEQHQPARRNIGAERPGGIGQEQASRRPAPSAPPAAGAFRRGCRVRSNARGRRTPPPARLPDRPPPASGCAPKRPACGKPGRSA